MHEIQRFEIKTEQRCKIRMGEKGESNSVIAAKKLYKMNA